MTDLCYMISLYSNCVFSDNHKKEWAMGIGRERYGRK